MSTNANVKPPGIELGARRREIHHGKRVGFQFPMVDQFVAEQNIAHYRSRLQMGAEPVTRAVILKLLLAEEKSLGQTREQLKQIDSHIEKLRRTIAQQKKRIERFQFMDSVIDTEGATLILLTLNDLMATYQQHRQWMTAGLADGSGS